MNKPFGWFADCEGCKYLIAVGGPFIGGAYCFAKHPIHGFFDEDSQRHIRYRKDRPDTRTCKEAGNE